MMARSKFTLLVLCLCATPVVAQELPADVTAYVDRRTGCNYWPSEPATDKIRKAEIQRHIRELRCVTLDREEAVLSARYHGKPRLLQAIADAHDAMPD